jgi:hypothetical protein
MDLLNTVMQWIVAPVAAVVYMIYNKQQEHHTDIAVLKSKVIYTSRITTGR